MDLKKLTTSDRVIVASGILLLIFSFMPWYGIGSASRNGWDYFLFGVIPTLLGLAMAAVVVIDRFTDVNLPELPLAWGQVHLIAGAVAAVLVLLRLAITDSVGGGSVLGVKIPSIDLDRKYGLFLAFLATIGLVVGGYLKMREASPSTAS